MQSPTWLRPPRGVHWTPKLAVTLILLVIAIALILGDAFRVVVAVFTYGGDVEPSATLENSLKKHDQLAKVDRDRFDGRSAFFMPPAPVRNIPKPPPPPKIEKPVPPPAPPIPVEYLGKKPIAVLGPIVYFDTFQIKVGEESNGIKVISTNAPWSVKLGHEGGEYEVALWERKKSDFLNGKWSTKHTPGIESASNPTLGKDKNNPNPGGRLGTTVTTGNPGSDVPTRTNGPRSAISPLGTTPSNPQPGSPLTTPAAGGGSSTPTGTGPSPSAPPPNEPNAPPPAGQTEAPNPASAPPSSSSPSAADSNGWNANRMAPPPPISTEQMNSMTLPEALATQAALEKVKSNPTLDGATSERLAQELATIQERINELKRGQSPPS